ncbi:hypothetical protein CMV_004579 [Castanea mollissima]|uniref:Gnk2-homologous domain-containing protein n=1 Tax=Castanea mollissima TaxID=60419 RepID=A0A8J4W264_9ROSI|nr:hypothetical protein CMV_004579 [Castanea mollissima]
MVDFKNLISLKLLSLFLLLSLLNLFSRSEGAPTYFFHSCSNSSFFTTNSTYQTNLNLLLSDLSSNSTRLDGFYKTSVGQNPPDVATGLLFCRGDLTPAACKDCISTATKDIQNRCPFDKIILIWYDVCTLRYTNESDLNNLVPFVNFNTTAENVIEPDRFNGLLASTMKSLEQKAANSQSDKKFATAAVKFTSSVTLYCLVQCTPELSVSGCLTVLESAIGSLPTCCTGKQGGTVALPSSNIRYELYPFFNYTASSIPLPLPRGKTKSSTTIIAIAVPISVAMVLFAIGVCFLRRTSKKYNKFLEPNAGIEITAVESLQFDLVTIETATNKFSDDNKIGKGGFGTVYKGTFLNGQEIAVKRLSKSSVQGGEKILIYEYVPNRSLDYFLFDSERQGQLDWSSRYKIIRIKLKEIQVESLEHKIISGKKSNCFYQSEHDEDLLSYTWKQWKNGTPIELLDPTVRGSHSRNEVIRCIHIGLLCVQENPANRPTMATVVLMLDSYSVSLQLPQQPAFLLRNKANRNMPKRELQHDSLSSQSVPLYPR